MTPALNQETLARAASTVKRAALTEWMMFLEALSDRYRIAIEECAEAGADTVARAQGRARELKDLLVLLRDAEKTVALYEKGRRT